MTKNELIRLRAQREKQYENAKTKRNILTILGFTVPYFIAFYNDEKPAGLEILGTLVVAFVVAGIHFFVNTLVFSNLVRIGEDERKALEYLDKQISDAQ